MGKIIKGDRGQALDVERAAALLKSARDVDTVQEIRAKAVAIKVYQRERAAGREAHLAAAEIVVRAERRIGELLLRDDSLRPGRRRKGESTATLDERGIGRKQSSRWQRAAEVEDDTTDLYLQTAKKVGAPATTTDLVRLSQLPRAEAEAVVLSVSRGEFRDLHTAIKRATAPPEEASSGPLPPLPDFDSSGPFTDEELQTVADLLAAADRGADLRGILRTAPLRIFRAKLLHRLGGRR